MGGKCRLRKWLVSHFPKFGNKYIEPFAGLGNVFYLAKKELKFNQWLLGDINTFLISMLNANLNELPNKVLKEDFNYWKSLNTHISKVIEPRITFAGKGYSAGFNGYHKSHSPYNGKLYKQVCEEARKILSKALVINCSWDKWDFKKLNKEDFVYFDPPYFGTKASYPNIDHEKLILILNNLNFKWALSGYANKLYDENLKFLNIYVKERNSEIKGSNTKSYQISNEILWTNY